MNVHAYPHPALAIAAIAACSHRAAQQVHPVSQTGVPLRQLPAGAALPRIRADLLASARAKFGIAMVDQAMAAPTFLIVKRFAGMVPPPPPGSDSNWMPPTPTAMLFRATAGWQTATSTGWRPLSEEAAVRLDSAIRSNRFLDEATVVPACPDYGASNLLLKISGRSETVRNAMCTSAASELVSAALAG